MDEVVANDLVGLRAGDQLVADGVVRASEDPETDESLLTGESEVDKRLATRCCRAVSWLLGRAVIRRRG